MAIVKPFKGVRPPKNLVEQIESRLPDQNRHSFFIYSVIILVCTGFYGGGREFNDLCRITANAESYTDCSAGGGEIWGKGDTSSVGVYCIGNGRTRLQVTPSLRGVARVSF